MSSKINTDEFLLLHTCRRFASIGVELAQQLLVVDGHLGRVIVHDTLVDALVGQKLRDLVEALGKTHELVGEDFLLCGKIWKQTQQNELFWNV